MITKQQALEFIYDLSQKTEVMLDVECGEMQFHRIIDGDYLYTTFAEKCTLEETVLKCIKENMEAIECLGIKQIPVDIDMLEIGKVYKIHTKSEYDEAYVTEKLLNINKQDLTYEIEGHYPCPLSDIKEIYKVIE